MGESSFRTPLEIVFLLSAIFLIFSTIYDIIFKKFPFSVVELNLGFFTIPNAIFTIVFVVAIVSGGLWKIFSFDVENKSVNLYKKSNNPLKNKEEMIRKSKNVEKINNNDNQKTIEGKKVDINTPKKNQYKDPEKIVEMQSITPQTINYYGPVHIGDNTKIEQQISGDVGFAKIEIPIKAESKTCPRCHNPIQDNDRFCNNCRKDLK